MATGRREEWARAQAAIALLLLTASQLVDFGSTKSAPKSQSTTLQPIKQRNGFPAPNEAVGERACSNLMLRLVDTLLDACETQLELLGGDPSTGKNETKPERVGNILHAAGDTLDQMSGLYDELGDTNRPLGSSEQVDEEEPLYDDAKWAEVFEQVDSSKQSLPSTKPLEWTKRRRNYSKYKKTTTKSATTSHVFDDELATSLPAAAAAEAKSRAETTKASSQKLIADCVRDDIEWVRRELLLLQKELSDLQREQQRRRGRLILVRALDTFASLQLRLATSNESACKSNDVDRKLNDDLDDVDSSDTLAYLFVREAIGVLAELAAEVSCKLDDETGAIVASATNRSQTTASQSINGAADTIDDELKGSIALDVVKRHYAYLTQIVAAYSLVFAGSELETPN